MLINDLDRVKQIKKVKQNLKMVELRHKVCFHSVDAFFLNIVGMGFVLL